MSHVGVAVNVVPTRVDQHAVVVDTGVPFLRLVVAQADHVAAVAVHRVQRVGGRIVRRSRPAAAQVAATPFRDEGNPAVRQIAGIKVVPGAVGQLDQLASIGVHLENVITAARRPLDPLRLAFRVGEQHFLAVE